ncbi:hypothetical protein [Micromonospora sp. NPDC049891]|uniref:hypothetical protein n=1 Tax=Micromonospora sp. NPDC049891 TaxID=3155655 RepID=UPI0033BFD30E
MAGYAFPTTAWNSRALTPREYEDLSHTYTSDGIYGFPTDPALVYADSSLRGVKIRANRTVLLRGLRWHSGSTDESLSLDANTTAGTTRIDLIVLRMSRNPWEVAPAVVKGTATATPVAPSPTYGGNTATGVWEMPLAEVTIPYNDNLTDPAQVTMRGWHVGSDGQYRCTAETRPPHEAGRRIWEHPSGRALISTGAQWILAGAGTSVSTANATVTGWSIGTDSIVTQAGNYVDVRLGSWTRTGGNIAAGSDVRLPCTVPTAARYPDRDRRMTVYISGGKVGGITVFSAGHPDRAGQVWLTSHNGLSTGNTIVGADITWWLPS